MMISGANILILDEPTNHLDMESITALNNGLIKFPGVILFTSHDHQFVQTTANRIMEILPNGKLVDKITTYDEYLASDEMAKKRHVFQVTKRTHRITKSHASVTKKLPSLPPLQAVRGVFYLFYIRLLHGDRSKLALCYIQKIFKRYLQGKAYSSTAYIDLIKVFGRLVKHHRIIFFIPRGLQLRGYSP